MNVYGILRDLAGLSLREASDFHRVRLDTVKSWSSGRNSAPDTVVAELCNLIEKQDRAALEAIAQIEQSRAQYPGAEIEIGYPADDYEAQGLGWPCIGAWQAMAARIFVAGLPIRLVPRGSSLSTAAAIEARE